MAFPNPFNKPATTPSPQGPVLEGDAALPIDTAKPARIGIWVLGLGFMGVIATFFSWWGEVIKEAHAGDHTPVVQLHLRYGMVLVLP